MLIITTIVCFIATIASGVDREGASMKRALLLWVLPLIVGCKSPAEGAVEGWLDAECDQRAALVSPSDATATWWKTPQDGGSSCVAKKKSEIDAKGCETAAVGLTCEVVLKGRDAPYCLFKAAESEFKIDAGCTYGMGERSLAEVLDKGLSEDEVVVLRGKLKLSEERIEGYAQDLVFIATLYAQGKSATIVAHRNSERGKALYEQLADGKEHRAALMVARAGTGKKDHLVLVDVGGQGWLWPEKARLQRAREMGRLRSCCSWVESHYSMRSSYSNESAVKKCAEERDAVLAGKSALDEAVGRIRALFKEGDHQPDICR